MPSRHRVPVWLMGLTNLTYGFYGGIVAFAVPQLLSARGVPEAQIAGLTAVAFSPGFWAFLFSPILDVRLSRRGYAVALAILSALTLLVAFQNLDRPALLETLLTAGFFTAYLYQSAIGGWLSSITSAAEESTVSVWITISNVGGFGVVAVLTNQLFRHLSVPVAAVVLSGSVLLPLAVFPFMQAPGPDRRLARESFGQFSGDLLKLVKRREVLVAIVLFAAPAATFSLTNFLGGRGADFHASAGFVGLVGGAGVAAGGVAGCLLFPLLRRLLPLRPLYLAIGFVGALVTLGFVLLPATPASYAVVLIGENLFQSMAVTTSIAITLDIIGRDNPLASTTFCFVASAYGVPISYMLYVDAFGFARHGIAGSFVADALAGIAAAVLLAIMLGVLARRVSRRTA